MTLPWKLLLSAVAVAAYLAASAYLLAPGRPAESRARDKICGPRCLQYVLSQYGKPSDLMELVKEVQWPNLNSGASLDRLGQALESRGIATMAVSIPRDAEVDWPHPVILPLNRSDDDSRGHYVVWTPTDGKFFLGDGGTASGALAKFADTRSGAALLTAPLAIASVPGWASRRGGVRAWVLWGMVLVGTGGLLSVLLSKRYHGKR